MFGSTLKQKPVPVPIGIPCACAHPLGFNQWSSLQYSLRIKINLWDLRFFAWVQRKVLQNPENRKRYTRNIFFLCVCVCVLYYAIYTAVNDIMFFSVWNSFQQSHLSFPTLEYNIIFSLSSILFCSVNLLRKESEIAFSLTLNNTKKRNVHVFRYILHTKKSNTQSYYSYAFNVIFIKQQQFK